MKIGIILANVEADSIILPDFQRGYVWSRRQVRQFFDSLYHGYPVGGLLTWLTTQKNGGGVLLSSCSWMGSNG